MLLLFLFLFLTTLNQFGCIFFIILPATKMLLVLEWCVHSVWNWLRKVHLYGFILHTTRSHIRSGSSLLQFYILNVCLCILLYALHISHDSAFQAHNPLAFSEASLESFHFKLTFFFLYFLLGFILYSSFTLQLFIHRFNLSTLSSRPLFVLCSPFTPLLTFNYSSASVLSKNLWFKIIFHCLIVRLTHSVVGSPYLITAKHFSGFGLYVNGSVGGWDIVFALHFVAFTWKRSRFSEVAFCDCIDPRMCSVKKCMHSRLLVHYLHLSLSLSLFCSFARLFCVFFV